MLFCGLKRGKKGLKKYYECLLKGGEARVSEALVDFFSGHFFAASIGIHVPNSIFQVS